MKEETIARLNALNRDFYQRFAADFSRTRARPWAGWAPIAERAGGEAREPLTVLDAGCGNGRFGEYLLARGLPIRRYVGLDSSSLLLAEAARRLERHSSVERVFRLCDLVERDLHPAVGAELFSLVAAIGILHHVPSRARRSKLFAELATSVAPGGILAASIWRFAAFDRFRCRFADWSEHERVLDTPIDLADLEPGDHLLRWGGDGLRYCHFIDRDEESELLAVASRMGLEPVARYEADGAGGELNRYFVLEA